MGQKALESTGPGEVNQMMNKLKNHAISTIAV